MNAIKKPSEVASALYTRKDVMSFAGLTLSDANSWPKKGIISVDQESAGTGHERLYTFLNVIEAATAKNLTRLFSLESVKKIMDSMRGDDIFFDIFKMRLREDKIFFLNDTLLAGYFDFDGELVVKFEVPSVNMLSANISELCFSVHLGILAHRVYNKINGIPEDESRKYLREHMTRIVKAREVFQLHWGAVVNPQAVLDMVKK